MNRGEALKRLIVGIHADCVRYEQFAALLDKQFSAALSHDATELARIGADMLELADDLSTGLKRRRAFASEVAGGATLEGVDDLLRLLSGKPRNVLECQWQRLAARIAECKRLNGRNANLLMMQQDVAQRILNTKDDIYDPH